MVSVLNLPNLKGAEPKKIIESIKNYIKLQLCSVITLAQVMWVLHDNCLPHELLKNSLKVDNCHKSQPLECICFTTSLAPHSAPYFKKISVQEQWHSIVDSLALNAASAIQELWGWRHFLRSTAPHLPHLLNGDEDQTHFTYLVSLCKTRENRVATGIK